MVQEKLIGKKLEKEAEESQMSFRPNISVMTQRIIAEKSQNRVSSAYQSLYEDAKRRHDEKDSAPKAEYSFKPALTTLDPELFKGVKTSVAPLTQR